ncbi:putative lipid II flippase FtsW [Subtercola frigoramans]|uniref:Probable peptidoglycan glycosyltransferase FtsW n=1 Tax=Subtercola frigoramans TaxID=120298 RepID=A0ABS2L0J4_9MICO|nr:putative lipid II flippase FtsW [Subtercola frigoramans]MBM7470594.1 cell division protein FtsW [Subtercola frigoramans]
MVSSNFYLLFGVTVFMVALGLVMVLSSSSVGSALDDNSSFSVFLRQGSYALIGIPLLLAASRLPSTFWKQSAWLVLAGGSALQFLVIATPLGVTVNGNRNWLQLGPLPALQPSELIKVGVVLWLGMFLTKKQHRITQFSHTLIPTVLVLGSAIILVALGGDLGTTVILIMMVLGGLFFAGIPIRHLLLLTIVSATIAILTALSRPNRVTRILSFLHPETADYSGSGWQIQHGYFALSNGGIFGVGLGNSTAKWSWLPAVDTDFIFAVIGEELGLIGACVVLVLIVVLGIALLRIIRATPDPFARIVTAAITVWIIGQALVNIAVVLGLLPVLGVPLPLISAGGTALISSLLAIGIVLSLCRESDTLQVSEPSGIHTTGDRSERVTVRK